MLWATSCRKFRLGTIEDRCYGFGLARLDSGKGQKRRSFLIDQCQGTFLEKELFPVEGQPQVNARDSKVTIADKVPPTTKLVSKLDSS